MAVHSRELCLYSFSLLVQTNNISTVEDNGMQLTKTHQSLRMFK